MVTETLKAVPSNPLTIWVGIGISLAISVTGLTELRGAPDYDVSKIQGIERELAVISETIQRMSAPGTIKIIKMLKHIDENVDRFLINEVDVREQHDNLELLVRGLRDTIMVYGLSVGNAPDYLYEIDIDALPRRKPTSSKMPTNVRGRGVYE